MHNAHRAAYEVLLATVAGTIAWVLAIALFDNPSPFFAPIAAIVCLGPGIPNHRQQAVGMFAGVIVGIAFGEAGRLLPITPTVQLAVLTPVAMLVAAAVSYRPVMITQSAASVVLVVASNQPASGFQRFADAAVGGCIGLLFTQVLFTPDPVAMIERAGAAWKAAGDQGDLAQERAAASAVDDAIDCAKGIARWSLRGRMKSADVAATASRWRRELDGLANQPEA